jgi:hypothetical protein
VTGTRRRRSPPRPWCACCACWRRAHRWAGRPGRGTHPAREDLRHDAPALAGRSPQLQPPPCSCRLGAEQREIRPAAALPPRPRPTAAAPSLEGDALVSGQRLSAAGSYRVRHGLHATYIPYTQTGVNQTEPYRPFIQRGLPSRALISQIGCESGVFVFVCWRRRLLSAPLHWQSHGNHMAITWLHSQRLSVASCF